MEERRTRKLWNIVGLVLAGFAAGLAVGELRSLRFSAGSSRAIPIPSVLPDRTEKNYANETVAMVIKPVLTPAGSNHSDLPARTPYQNQTVKLRMLSSVPSSRP
jgi:hypothetical protein